MCFSWKYQQKFSWANKKGLKCSCEVFKQFINRLESACSVFESSMCSL